MSNENVPSLEELAQRALKGDARAETMLLEQVRQRLIRFASKYGVGGNCEDLAQDTLIKLFQNLAKLNLAQPGTVMSWSYTALRRLVVDYWRKKDNNLASLEEMAESGPKLTGSVTDDPAIKTLSSRALVLQLLETVMACPECYGLTEVDWRAFHLYSQGWTYTEVADILYEMEFYTHARRDAGKIHKGDRIPFAAASILKFVNKVTTVLKEMWEKVTTVLKEI